MSGRTQRPVVHLWKAETRPFGGHDHVRIAHQSNAGPQAESVDGSHHGHRALIYRPEGLTTRAVGFQEAKVATVGISCLNFLDVHTGTEAAPFRSQHHSTYIGPQAVAVQHGGQAVGIGDT